MVEQFKLFQNINIDYYKRLKFYKSCIWSSISALKLLGVHHSDILFCALVKNFLQIQFCMKVLQQVD